MQGPDRPGGLDQHSGGCREPCPLGRSAQRAPHPRPAGGGGWHSPSGGPLGTQALNSPRTLGTQPRPALSGKLGAIRGILEGPRQLPPGVSTLLDAALKPPAGRSPRAWLQGKKRMPVKGFVCACLPLPERMKAPLPSWGPAPPPLVEASPRDNHSACSRQNPGVCPTSTEDGRLCPGRPRPKTDAARLWGGKDALTPRAETRLGEGGITQSVCKG